MDEKYQRIKVLGKGSFGKAYLVRNTEENELCVVKQMETSAMEAKERNEAVKEAMLLKKMDHPNIVRFKEVFITRKHRLCIVMDYADGGDVHMKIKSREGALLPEEQILEWFVQTCFALKHVHERKVLHRDLKTQNIFLMSNGHVKLGDFGIARVLDATKDYARTMVGTPYYLSPEIIEDRPYNFKSDIWSLGVVLYEMTTLKHPFDADSLVILASKILKDQYPPPDSSYSPDLLSLIRSMLCKDAQQRPLITKVLCYSFLQDIMQHANSTYHLGLDLSEFAKAAAAVPRTPQVRAPLEEQDASMTSKGIEASTEAEEEYEEEFEDYSGSEDGGEDGKSDLRHSVANLKIGGGGGAYAAAPPPPPGGGEPPGPGEVRAPSATSSYAAKAASLRVYLRDQMPEDEFRTVHALVCASGEVSAQELQQRVHAVLGADKALELLTLFQLLCFLENVSAGAAHPPPPPS